MPNNRPLSCLLMSGDVPDGAGPKLEKVELADHLQAVGDVVSKFFL